MILPWMINVRKTGKRSMDIYLCSSLCVFNSLLFLSVGKSVLHTLTMPVVCSSCSLFRHRRQLSFFFIIISKRFYTRKKEWKKAVCVYETHVCRIPNVNIVLRIILFFKLNIHENEQIENTKIIWTSNHISSNTYLTCQWTIKIIFTEQFSPIPCPWRKHLPERKNVPRTKREKHTHTHVTTNLKTMLWEKKSQRRVRVFVCE